MGPRIYPIDWRDEFSQLAPYLHDQGGVVRIRYAGGRCAPSAFLGTLKSEYENWNNDGNRRSIRIDHQVYTVRYLSGIRDEFVRLMKLELPRADGVEGVPGGFSVFADVEAETVEADISNVTQHNYFAGENPALMSRNRERWVKALRDRLSEFLAASHMMIVVNHGPSDGQDEFWRYMWCEGLDTLVDAGLLLVHMVDVSDQTGGIHGLAPVAQLEINLPATLTLRARGEAIEDLAQIIVRAVPTIPADRARGEAHALVTAHVDDIPRLHNKYAACMMELQREFA